MALYGRTYTLPTYEHVVIEAASQEEADKLFEQLEGKWRYKYTIARYFVGCDAKDEWPYVECVGSFDGEEYGYGEPDYTDEQIANMLKED